MRKNARTIRTIMVMLLVMGLVFSAGNASACGLGGHGDQVGPQIMANLDLTADQVKKLKEERIKSQKQMIKLRAELQTLWVDLRSETGKDEPNLSRVDMLAGQIGELKGKMIAAHTKSVIYLLSILTPEQKRKMDVMQLQAMESGHGGHKKRSCGGGNLR